MAILERDERSVREINTRTAKYARIRAAQSAPEPKDDDRATPDDSVDAWPAKLPTANIKFLSSLVQQLVELRNAPEKDEYGTLRATKHAFDSACNLLIDAAIVSAVEGRKIPYGC